MADKEIIMEKIKELAPNNKLSCAKAHQLAADLDVEPDEIGELCDELKIKIYGCRLGCF